MGKIEDFVKRVYEKSQSRNWWVFETPEWSFVDGKEKVLIKGKKYNLSNILCNDVTSAELKSMTDKVLDLIATKKGLNKSTIAKIKVTGVSVYIYILKVKMKTIGEVENIILLVTYMICVN
jgi:hypothetical protein